MASVSFISIFKIGKLKICLVTQMYEPFLGHFILNILYMGYCLNFFVCKPCDFVFKAGSFEYYNVIIL